MLCTTSGHSSEAKEKKVSKQAQQKKDINFPLITMWFYWGWGTWLDKGAIVIQSL